jgi:chromosome segregation ATPase
MNLQLEDLKKSAKIAWDELDKSHTARAKLHDELIIAEGQRDQWKMRAETAEETFTLAVARADEFEREYLRVTREYMHLHAEVATLTAGVKAAQSIIEAKNAEVRDAYDTQLAAVIAAATAYYDILDGARGDRVYAHDLLIAHVRALRATTPTEDTP